MIAPTGTIILTEFARDGIAMKITNINRRGAIAIFQSLEINTTAKAPNNEGRIFSKAGASRSDSKIGWIVDKSITPKNIIITVTIDEYELLHDRIGLMGIEPISEKDYYVRGTTALLDAIGKSINKIINVQKNTARDERAEKVMFVITTDGMENASREYTYDRIKAMIEHQKERYNWEFLFLGANIDAVETAAKFGIDRDRATNFHSDKIGSAINYQIISETVQPYKNAMTKKEALDEIRDNAGTQFHPELSELFISIMS